jgi:gamma-glutamyl hydrolase
MSLTFVVLADGNLYVSTVEGINMPIFATQYHPEKPNFEFSDMTIPHTRTAGDVGYRTAQVFIETAKLNARQIPYADQVGIVIQNYERVFIAADPEEIKERDPLPDSVWMIPDDAGKIPHRGEAKVLVH